MPTTIVWDPTAYEGPLAGIAEGLDALLIRQQPNRSGPVGAPQTAIEAKRIEDAAERIPQVFVGEWLVRQGAGAADFNRDIGVYRQSQQLWQRGKRLHRCRWHLRLWQAKVVDH